MRPPQHGTSVAPWLEDKGWELDGGDPPCPAGPLCCSPGTGIWLARTICSFRPVAMATGWLEMGFHQPQPGMMGKTPRKSLPCFFPSWAEMKGRGRDPPPSFLPAGLSPGSSCSPPFPFLSLNACVQQQDGLWLCRCVLGGVFCSSASPPALVLFPSIAHH